MVNVMLSNKHLNNINILLCTDNYLRIGAEQIGGIERISITLVNSLRKKGCHFFNAFKKIDDGTRFDNLDDHNFNPYERIQIQKETSVDSLTEFLIENDITIIHIQQAETRDFLFYHLAAERAGCKIIYSMQEKPLQDLFKYNFSYLYDTIFRVKWADKLHYLARLLFSRIEYITTYKQIQKKYIQCFKYCDKIVIQSELFIPTLEKLLQRQLSTKSLIKQPNCVSYSQFFLEENIIELKRNEIIIVGDLEEATSQISLVIDVWKEIYKEFPLWSIHIIGSGSDFEYYKSIIKPKHRIYLEGRQEPLSYYQTASIYINTTISTKSFCSSLLEAMQNAVVPIILNTNEIYNSIIESDVNGYVVADINQLKSKLKKLINDDGSRIKMAKRTVSKAKSYNQQTFARNYYNIYRTFN